MVQLCGMLRKLLPKRFVAGHDVDPDDLDPTASRLRELLLVGIRLDRDPLIVDFVAYGSWAIGIDLKAIQPAVGLSISEPDREFEAEVCGSVGELESSGFLVD